MDDRIRPDYEAAAKWLQQRWESEAVQDGFPSTPWDDLELEDRDWWLTQAQGVVAAALADSDALIIRRDKNGEWPEWTRRAIAEIGPWAGNADQILDALASSQGVEP